jgi:hypothetical protein
MGLRTSSDAVQQPYNWVLAWLLWVIATTVASSIALIICVIVAFMTWGTGLLGAGIIIGMFVGGAQGLVLHQLGLRLTTASSVRRWMIANSLGGGISFIATLVLWSSMIAFYVLVVRDTREEVIYSWYLLFTVVSVSLGFGLLGFSQWIILRDWIRNGLWWISLNVLGGVIAMAVGSLLFGPTIVRSVGSDPVVALDLVVLVFSVSVLITAIWSLVSGAGLILLMKATERNMHSH